MKIHLNSGIKVGALPWVQALNSCLHKRLTQQILFMAVIKRKAAAQVQ